MSADPSANVVVFEVAVGGQLKKLVGNGPTRASDCVRQVWRTLSASNQLTPDTVRRLYSEWEPSDDDKAFISATFKPDLQVTFSFSRPPENGWDVAMREVGQTIATAVTKAKAKKPWWRFWN
jgi:hypothetical protein